MKLEYRSHLDLIRVVVNAHSSCMSLTAIVAQNIERPINLCKTFSLLKLLTNLPNIAETEIYNGLLSLYEGK